MLLQDFSTARDECLPCAGIKSRLAGAAQQGMRSIGSHLKLGGGAPAGKHTSGTGGSSEERGTGSASDDFCIAAGGATQLSADAAVEDAWQQVRQ